VVTYQITYCADVNMQRGAAVEES